MSWMIEVIADDSGKWCGNGVRLESEEEAGAYARHKMATWILVRRTRIVESPDPPNYRFNRGNLEAL